MDFDIAVRSYICRIRHCESFLRGHLGARGPEATITNDTREVIKKLDECAMSTWQKVIESKAIVAILGFSLPMKDVDEEKVRQKNRATLTVAETARLNESKMIWMALLKMRAEKDPIIKVNVESPYSMSMRSQRDITSQLREIDSTIGVVGIDSAANSWVEGRNIFWTNWHVQTFEEDNEVFHQGIRNLYSFLEMPRLINLLEDNFRAKWRKPNAGRFAIFTEPTPGLIPVENTCVCLQVTGETAADRHEKDSKQYPFDHYHEENLLWRKKEGTSDVEWRRLNSNEKLRLFGFPDGYLRAVEWLTDHQVNVLAASASSIPVLTRILATLPESEGAWPPTALVVHKNQFIGESPEQAMEDIGEHDDETEDVSGTVVKAPTTHVAGHNLVQAGIELMEERPLTSQQVGAARRLALDLMKNEDVIGIVYSGEQWHLAGYSKIRKLVHLCWFLPWADGVRFDGFGVAATETTLSFWEWAGC